MKHYQIIDGPLSGLIGRRVGTIEGFIILLIQTRDGWILQYKYLHQLQEIKYWSLAFCNQTNYVEKLK